MLTYTAHNPTATIEFLKDEYPERAEKGGLFDIKKGELENQKATELYNEFGNPYQVVPRVAINYVAETLKHIHNPNFEDATRYYVQPHARVLRLNYNKFNVLCDPSVVGGPVFYRSINAPVRLVSENEITDDAMDW